MTDQIAEKAMSLEEKRDALWRAFDDTFRDTRQAEGPSAAPEVWVVDMYEDYVIVISNGDHFKVPYTMDAEGKVEFAALADWTPVKEIHDWVERTNAFKAISKTDDELVVENYIVLFGGRDLEGVGSKRVNPDGSKGEFFTKNTDFESDYTKTGCSVCGLGARHRPGRNRERS